MIKIKSDSSLFVFSLKGTITLSLFNAYWIITKVRLFIQIAGLKQNFLKIATISKNWRKETAVNVDRFFNMILKAIAVNVVSWRFVRSRPKPNEPFKWLKPRSTSIRSALSWYSNVLSWVSSFFRCPREGPKAGYFVLCSIEGWLDYDRFYRLILVQGNIHCDCSNDG